jgi:hypothetical protein
MAAGQQEFMPQLRQVTGAATGVGARAYILTALDGSDGYA